MFKNLINAIFGIIALLTLFGLITPRTLSIIIIIIIFYNAFKLAFKKPTR